MRVSVKNKTFIPDHSPQRKEHTRQAILSFHYNEGLWITDNFKHSLQRAQFSLQRVASGSPSISNFQNLLFFSLSLFIYLFFIIIIFFLGNLAIVKLVLPAAKSYWLFYSALQAYSALAMFGLLCNSLSLSILQFCSALTLFGLLWPALFCSTCFCSALIWPHVLRSCHFCSTLAIDSRCSKN